MRTVSNLMGLVISLSLILLSPTISKALSVFPKSPEDAERKVSSSLLEGTQNVLIVLVESPKQPHSADQLKSGYEKALVAGLDSYYKEVSYGNFGVSVRIIDWVKVSDEIVDKHERAKEALNLTWGATIPVLWPNDYDKDGDGELDFVLIFDTKAPQDSEATSMELEGIEPKPIPGTGKKLDWYVYMRPSRELALVAHEFGHLLGLLDMYSSALVGGTIGDIGRWGLMSGAIVHGTPYSHLCAYSKVKLGWATPIELNQSGDRIIKAAEIKDYGSIYRISTSKPNEYFLLEYRQRRGYDRDLPGEGLLIWHIDLSVGWGNENGHYRVELVPADGELNPNPLHPTAHAGDPFPGSTNTTSFTASLYDGSDPGIRITKISRGSSLAGTTLRKKGRRLTYEGNDMSFHFSREGEPSPKLSVVWPGDTDNDGTVNGIDILPLGSYWLGHGPARYNYSGINGSGRRSEYRRLIRWWDANRWSARTVPVWNNSGATYADANGDGLVNGSDTTTITFNWKYTHSPSSAPSRETPLAFKLGNDLASDLVRARRILEKLDATPENDEFRAMLHEFIDSAGSDQNLVKLSDNQALFQNPQEKFQLQLAQNYPNPVNPETWIPFSLADDSDVSVKIYNLSGSLVRTLDLGQRPAGDYSEKNMAAYWDGKDENGEEVASGTYLYQLQAGPATQTRKMIVLK